MNAQKRYHPGWNLEYAMFLFTRLSGFVFFLLAIIGLLWALYMGARLHMDVGTLLRWTFFPNPNHILDSNIPNTDPWMTGLWQIFQIVILAFAGTHGMNGLRVVAEDYIHAPVWQMFTRFVIFLLWIFMLLIAIYVVIS